MSYRKPKIMPTEEPLYEALVGFSCRHAGVARFVPAGTRLAGSDPLIRSPWRAHFIQLPATTEERAAAGTALARHKEAANPPREGKPRFAASTSRPVYALRGDKLSLDRGQW